MTIYRQVPQGVPSAQIFGTFRRWPLLPSAELLRLQATLKQCFELDRSEAAQDLLRLVTQELQLRSVEEPADARRLSGPPGPPSDRPVTRGKSGRNGRSRYDQSGPANGQAGPFRAPRA
ncbi:hypothetical protein [Arthrobacter sp. UYEF36]|uniref:hypothetical protein n=1 Tax=Arthrobacter sp. UYEF36 TaxID=1756366 RepID=UPI00339A7EE4